jgi:hypothetical protein
VSGIRIIVPGTDRHIGSRHIVMQRVGLTVRDGVNQLLVYPARVRMPGGGDAAWFKDSKASR